MLKSNLALIYHLFSKDKSMRGQVSVPNDSSLWPKSWKEVEYKKYHNSGAVIDLNGLETEVDSRLLDVLLKRKSSRDFAQRKHKISLQELATILKNSCGLKEVGNKDSRRMYPSGGGRYSQEFYILVQNPLDFPEGLYHYNILENKLYLLNKNYGDVSGLFVYDWAEDFSLAFFVTSVFDRTMRKYGERAYRFILQESGHIGQNIYLLTTALGLSAIAIAGTNDQEIEELLGIDGESESLVYTLLVG